MNSEPSNMDSTMSDENLIDLNHLDKISGGNQSFIREILEIFLEQTPKEIALLGKYLEEDNYQQAEYYAHKLKSAADSVGFETGRQLFNQIEDASRERKTENLSEPLEEVEKVCSKAIQQVALKLEKGL